MKIKKIDAKNYHEYVKEGNGIAIFIMGEDGYEFAGKAINEKYVALLNAEGRWFVAKWYPNCFADTTSYSYSSYEEAKKSWGKIGK